MTSQAIAAPSGCSQLVSERNQRLRWAFFSSLLTKPLAIVIPILIVPVFLKYLGTEGYGLFETIVSLTGWLALSNLGLAMGLMNTLTGCYVSHDRSFARRHVSTFFFASAVLMIF